MSRVKRGGGNMARMPRLVVPGYPHHITQRGNRRMRTFFNRSDYVAYLKLLAERKAEAGVDVWAYCLMPNHVHLVVVPGHEESLADLFRMVHQRYTLRINRRESWQGHLWQERFHSFVMDERHLSAAVRYTELNPVRAQLCSHPRDWAWSSARAHLRGRDDAVVSVGPMLERHGNWAAFLSPGHSGEALDDELRRHARTGRPAGEASFLKSLESMTGRTLLPKRPGPTPKLRQHSGDS